MKNILLQVATKNKKHSARTKETKFQKAAVPTMIILTNLAILLSVSQYKMTGYAISEGIIKTNKTLLLISLLGIAGLATYKIYKK